MKCLAGLGCALAVTALAPGPAAADEHVWVRVGDPARLSCGGAPAGWQRPGLDDSSWGERNIVIERRDGGVAAAAPSSVPGEGGEAAPVAAAPAAATVDLGTPCGVRFVRWHFRVGPEVATLRTVTLRLRYTHGFAAYLNGSEIARRRLDAGAPPEALASDVHGPEFERFIVPASGLLHPGDNVLAVEVHPRTAGRETSLELSLSGDDGPRIVRGPYLLWLRENEATVVFDTDLPTSASLAWGPTERYGSAASDGLGTHHVMRMTRLRAATVYHYRVRALSAPPEAATARHDGGEDGDGDATATGAEAGGAAPARGGSAGGASGERVVVQTHNNAHGERGRSVVQTHKKPPASATAPPADTLADAGDASFHTPPETGRPLRFAVYGDVRSGHDIHAALNQALADEQPDLAILTGDLVDRGSDEGDWERFFEIAGPLLRQLAIFPAAGNHEYAKRGTGLTTFMQLFRWPFAPVDEPPWYSFDVAGSHFVALASNEYKQPRQLAWFEHDLKEARRRKVRAIFVYAHEGPASSGLHGDNPVCAHDYVPIMERYHVSMFFGGHDHDYERGRLGTLDYAVTGGGGAELRPARCGVPGKRPCPPRVALFVNEHNYIMVEVLPSLFRVCPKRVDGTAIEACVQYPLR